ncbi:MAG: exodeoxyribonuclease V subunit gamma, partial [Pseudomonadota bacterium]
MALRLYTSNRLEILADQLSQVLLTPLPSPFDREVIVVQSKGMERWISMQLAQRHGICANVHFPFPNHFVQEIFRIALPGVPEHPLFDPKIMTWRIMGILPSCLSRPGFESLRLYLQGNREGLKRLQLAGQISELFDQYLIFRPEMILGWEKGQENHWQADLWRELATGHEEEHPAALGKALFQTLNRSASAEIEGYPKRVSVFGIPALPRFHVQVLAGISRFTQVNLFLMNPCREYWAHILSEWEIKRTMEKRKGPEHPFEELHLEKGNSLLASMGTLGRDFFNLVNDYDYEEIALFEEPGHKNILSSIQADILNLRDRPQAEGRREGISSDDLSIQIHSCHSPMREMEILHDQLLRLFEEDPTLRPSDILVMTPDMDAYSPYIQAVFDLPVDDPKRVPFTISDRGVRNEGLIIDPFMAILELCGSRFGVSQVISILESGPVRSKFSLSESDLDLIRKWVDETRIRWGMDETNRAQLGLPPTSENTWKAGLERLLLGYAMPGQDCKVFSDILPYDRLEGEETLVLGNLMEFMDRLFHDVGSLARPRPLEGWTEALAGLLDRFFSSDENTEREIQLIRQTINDLGALQQISSFGEEMDILTMRWYLGHLFQKKGFGFGFLGGGVTFCAMLPMRSIPFRVICLVGMDGEVYPRKSQTVGFDLMSRHPKPGDRSRRNDDRYLFFEALLSARERLYISYVGQSIQDNSPIPPSVLVSELLDYIEQGFPLEGEALHEHRVVKHRLQAFSQDYFQDHPKLFSYSHQNFHVARSLTKPRQAPDPFISKGLTCPGVEWKRVELDDLYRFFNHPVRYLLTKRLGIHLDEKALLLDEKEVFELKGLERYLIEESLLNRGFLDHRLIDLLPVWRASGRLPHGTVGDCLFEGLVQGIERFIEKTKPYMEGKPLDPIPVDLTLTGFRLTGRVHGVYPGRMIHYRYGRIKPRDHLKVWFHHLVLNSIRPGDTPRSSLLAGLNPESKEEFAWTAWEYAPVKDSAELLKMLLERYWAGLMHPLRFFPDSSWEYARS